MLTRPLMLAVRRTLGIGLLALQGATGAALAAAQGNVSIPPAAPKAEDAPTAQGSLTAPRWHTGALVLGGLAAIGFMHGRRRYD